VPAAALSTTIEMGICDDDTPDYEVKTTDLKVVVVADLLPEGQTFASPVTVRFGWYDLNENGRVDDKASGTCPDSAAACGPDAPCPISETPCMPVDTGIRERNLVIWKNGCQLTTQCDQNHGGCRTQSELDSDAACVAAGVQAAIGCVCEFKPDTGGMSTNYFEMQVSSFSEFTLAELTPCGPVPATGCRQPTVPLKAKLIVQDKTPDTADLLVWKWIKGAETLVGDFGDPLTDESYALCLYDQAGNQLLQAVAPGGETCGTADCWKSLGASGFRYVDKEREPDGLLKLLLKAGESGKAKLLAKGKGENLPRVPTPPLSLPLKVQIVSSSGQCWEAEYFAAGVIKNEAGQFMGTAGSP